MLTEQGIETVDRIYEMAAMTQITDGQLANLIHAGISEHLTTSLAVFGPDRTLKFVETVFNDLNERKEYFTELNEAFKAKCTLMRDLGKLETAPRPERNQDNAQDG